MKYVYSRQTTKHRIIVKDSQNKYTNHKYECPINRYKKPEENLFFKKK